MGDPAGTLAAAVPAMAARASGLMWAPDSSGRRRVERDVQPEVVEPCRDAALRSPGGRWRRSAGRQLGLRGFRPDAGAVDIVLSRGDRPLEAVGTLCGGFVLVGGPPEAVDRRAPGSEPFSASTWEVTSERLLTAPGYSGWWARWRREVRTRPRLVPAAVRTSLPAIADGRAGPGTRVALARVRPATGECLELDPEGRPVRPSA